MLAGRATLSRPIAKDTVATAVAGAPLRTSPLAALVERFLGQQTGSKRLKSASLNHAESDRESPGSPYG
jgi:hypothetical protein